MVHQLQPEACGSEQQYVVILVRNEGQSQLGPVKHVVILVQKKEKDGPAMMLALLEGKGGTPL